MSGTSPVEGPEKPIEFAMQIRHDDSNDASRWPGWLRALGLPLSRPITQKEEALSQAVTAAV